MPVSHKEVAFEQAIEDALLARGYHKGDPATFDRVRCLDPGVLLAFVKETQPKIWDVIQGLYTAKAEPMLLDDLGKAIDGRGLLDVLRHGFKCTGKLVRVAYFQPASGLNPETERLYAANRLTVTRQLHYSTSDAGKSLDLVLSLNGLPPVTAELKHPLSGQTFEHAMRQYRTDRDPREPIFRFKRGALVHFAVDSDQAAMTTRLERTATRFLPFNRGDGTAAGNPPNPGGYKTAYLWEQVWARDSLLDILARFVHLEVTERMIGGKKVTSEALIFPRYHQLDVVRKLEADARASGAGQNYLVQHSAGSGKSNSIAWLAHRLASLHDDEDRKVFDSVVVVTDRRVLDRQLQDTIYQIEHRSGVVEKIDLNSAQLAAALQSGTPIVITTLQKFPFVTEHVGGLPGRTYAVIVDEAHSSQSGEAATELRGVLAGEAIAQAARVQAEAEGLADYEEEILKAMARHGKQPNLSFFAFTATPKYKTLEMFGRKGADGRPVPFHLYSMRQAIEEKFILDVLRHYTTYATYVRLVKAAEDDPRVQKRKAARALRRFIRLHPHNVAEKTEEMVEHFSTHTRHKIGGRAKAMVVTESRLAAVRYRQAIDAYLRKRGYEEIKALVAFSGEVTDPDTGAVYTESKMNGGITEKALPDEFATDRYQILVVAEKYQTGFDQPLLHTMYVDKRLDGVQAVQTLSRLNRTCLGKEDTFVLDFVNSADEIHEAFRPYYEQPSLGERAEPSQLYQLQAELDAAQVYYRQEVDNFASVVFAPKATHSTGDQGKLHAWLDPAVSRFSALDEEAQEAFRTRLVAFRNLYGFLSQVMPYQDADLEKLYAFVRLLLTKLPRRGASEGLDLGDEVALKFYRLQKISEGAIQLEPGEGGEVRGPTAVGTGETVDERVELSTLIELVNERFGTDFTAADELFFEQIREEAVADESLRQAAHANSVENFRYVFDQTLTNLFIDRMGQNQEIFARFMNDKPFQQLVTEHLLHAVYEQITSETAGEPSAMAGP